MLNLDCNVTCLNTFDEDSWLCHRKLGHVSFDHLSRIKSKESVKGIPYLKFEKDRIYDACQLGKQTKSSFKPIKDIMTSRPLELIHMDLFGLTKAKSLNENHFVFVFVFVDDFSRLHGFSCWNIKIKLFSIFNVFRKRIEKEKGFLILCIRSDGGGELINHSFIIYCEK